MQIREIPDSALVTPPAAVSLYAWVANVNLTTAVSVLTIIYLVLTISKFVWVDWIKPHIVKAAPGTGSAD
jgi:phosphatidylglycerophosphatase A